MYHRREPQYRYICYSCITGNAVWIYQGRSREGMLAAYRRVRRRETALERRWPRMVKQRSANILHLLDECMAAMPILGKLTGEQREAVKTLQQLASNPPKYYTEFYNHIRTEHRRRDRKSRRWHSKEHPGTDEQRNQ